MSLYMTTAEYREDNLSTINFMTTEHFNDFPLPCLLYIQYKLEATELLNYISHLKF